ncbi:MAG: hypothetical protein OEM82_08055 [Acidobacteriota bacterium]|nr:hypothetical protein [Acidobacteriota bacterium]MDH3530514.1 hypothetical protein [Acidobacteriota bacterium]
MRKIAVLSLVWVLGAIAASAQNGLPDIGIQSNLALGVVKNVGAEKIALETKDGRIEVVFLSVTVFKRLTPDNLKLSAAQDAALSDIGVGDRLLVTGQVSENKDSIYANKIFLVKGSDLEQKAAEQRRQWQMRGIAGKVTALDPASKAVTVKISSVIGAGTSLVVTPKEGAKFLRYSEVSARYSDAVESSYSDIQVGDNIQALGDKSGDGSAFAAEELISGAFVTVAGSVKSVDASKNEVTIEDIETKQDITVVVNGTSLLKEFPEEIAQRLAMFIKMGGAGAAGGQRGGGNRPAGGRGEGQGEGRGGGQGRGPGGGMGDINQLLNRFPNITVSDLKLGDLIAVSSPKPKDPGRVTAIKLLAGVGPFLSAKSSASGGQRGVPGSLNVPGLDSFEF